MISNKYCVNGCSRKVFAHNRCIYCYRKEILYPKQLEKQRSNISKPVKIRPVSVKRQLLNKEYERKKQENNLKLIILDKFHCFFTLEPFPKGYSPDYHHTLGRDGDLLTDMSYAFPCYFKPHREFHDLKHDYQHLYDCNWYSPWLDRMKKEYPIIYFKELRTIEKANNNINGNNKKSY